MTNSMSLSREDVKNLEGCSEFDWLFIYYSFYEYDEQSENMGFRLNLGRKGTEAAIFSEQTAWISAFIRLVMFMMEILTNKAALILRI